ncbi:MAG: DALR domain-containing protein, partial [Limisphaerales bacterium]
RYLLLSARFRESFNFTLEGLQSARVALARLDECGAKLRELAAGRPATVETNDPLLADVTRALDDDLNVSLAWGAVFEWVREQNRRITEGNVGPFEASSALGAWETVLGILGLLPSADVEAPEAVRVLAEARQAARKGRDFGRADALRDELKALGWVVEDTPKGPKLKRA